MVRCPECASAVDVADAVYCPRCGTPLPEEAGTVPPPPQSPLGSRADMRAWDGRLHGISSESRHWAVGAHLSALLAFVIGLPVFLGFVGPLVVWLLKRDEDPFVGAHAREALNFNLSLLLYVVAAAAVGAFAVLVTFGVAALLLVPAALAAVVGWVVVLVTAASRAASAQAYEYPLTIRFV